MVDPLFYITGNKGYAGSYLTHYFRGLGYKVTGCDLEDGKDFAFQDIPKGAIVIHTAALTSVTESRNAPAEYIHNNMTKLLRLMEHRVIFLSSCSVYGDFPGKAREEDASLDRCKSVYAMTKLVGEWLIKHYFKDYLILRLSNLYGVKEGNAMWHFENDDPIVVYGNPKREFLLLSRLAEAILTAVKKDITGTYNLGSGDLIPIEEMAGAYANARNVKLQHEPARAGEIESLEMDFSRVKEWL